MTGERWMVVDYNGNPIFAGMYRQENAQEDADRLNREGVPEGRPYRVERDLITEDEL